MPIKFDDKLLHFVNTVYDVNLLTSEGGSVSASPLSGNSGTEITLTNTPNKGYMFERYELSGSTLYDGNKFKIKKSDVNVRGYFYPSVTIDTQIWTSKNLAIDDGQGGITTQTVNYGQGDVTEYYYTFAAAVRVAAKVPGWHLPSKSEWDTLFSTAGSSNGVMLKSTYGWESNPGTDDYGFAAFPAGQRDRGGSTTYQYFGTIARFWTSTAANTTSSYYSSIYRSSSPSTASADNTYGFSVRLVRNS